MLVSLYIENYALIDKQSIEFSEGFNVISGETGAGKSIIVGALSLIMGERASTDLIKTGKQKAILEAVFDIRHQTVLGYENEETLIITRELSSNGRNIIKINGRTITQADLRNTSKYLLDIHGQHQHQLLIDPQNHLEILDLFIPENLRKETAQAFLFYAQAKTEYKTLCQSRDLRQEEKDFLKFQLEELTAANPQPGEYAKLLTEKSRMDSYTEIAETTTAITETANFIKDNLHKNKALLFAVSAKESSLQNLADQAESLDIAFEDFRETLNDYTGKLEFSPERLDEVNERLDTLKNLKRKHLKKMLSEEEDLGTKLQEKQQEIKTLLDNLEFSDEKMGELEQKLKNAEGSFLTQAKELSTNRKTLAKKMEAQIISALQDLKMKSVQFHVSFQKAAAFSATGIDAIEFLISPNPGEPLKPLTKIASGGELSRIMLAIKSILLDKDQISSMVFDEIDTGIGGETANAIAAKISAISKKHQVICITHLAQIASVADRHLRVSKNSDNEKTTVLTEILTPAERELEIARMLSGIITEATKAHAKELLKA